MPKNIDIDDDDERRVAHLISICRFAVREELRFARKTLHVMTLLRHVAIAACSPRSTYSEGFFVYVYIFMVCPYIYIYLWYVLTHTVTVLS